MGLHLDFMPIGARSVAEFEREIGMSYLKGMHLNDSKAELSSKKDRHDNIGQYAISYISFRASR